MGSLFAAEAATSGSRSLTITLFLVFVAITLGITVWASRQTKTATDFYAGGRQFSGFQNGMAIGGDYMSAASFLGIAGLIALYGYDGFLYSIGFLVAWLVALLLVAEFLRNSGRYTMADVLAFRMRQRPVRTAASVSTIVVSIFYLIAQMVGAGALVSLLLGLKPGTEFLGMDADTAKVATIILVGALMIIYVTVGGMKGTTYVQIVKAFMLMGGAFIMVLLVLAHYKFNLSALLGDAATRSGKGSAFLEPGLRYGVETAGDAAKTFYSKMDLLSLGLALVLGTAGLPHILTRFYTVPTSRIARKSVLWAIGIIGTFYLFTLALGFGAAALVGGENITAQDKAGNTAAPQLAQQLGIDYLGGDTGGSIMLAVIAAVAFATILAVVAGLTLASSSSLAHDFYANVIKRGNASERDEVRVARISALIIGAVAIALSIFAQSLNVAFLVALAFAVAASANLPAILYSLFWRRFNTSGALWSIYGGLASAVILVFFSPVVSGSATAMFPDQDWHWFPLSNPGIISIPLGFLFGWIGTVISKETDPEKYAELEVRSVTGHGAH
ncbi:putative sodium:solute symporter [Actinoplanes missouriensis 431]|uniref:Putative sodium:solute symporter n=1 Tax=Actinoplanes missouriensis (strain ATCC 14538 / DSM 43046 / CBS 188.64 / JCM 3121 / NBRC 102363 / NCIMB 12654 / NRRL B-3342 / UNCC 431) TaxID=512565 RepID=I0HJR8_ACTM4|nr:cation acetate symporter [Actinoplanes missouriensis]BAL93255.1 putative sodium:solute symporter [Actinoplanes missouriensis 431]